MVEPSVDISDGCLHFTSFVFVQGRQALAELVSTLTKKSRRMKVNMNGKADDFSVVEIAIYINFMYRV